MADSFPVDNLIDLYRLALDEYRFEVRLGWDRTMYFLILNSAILTVATGLLKADGPPAVYLFVGLLFILGFGTSTIGAVSIARNHEYYRRTVVKKTLIENQLGLGNSIPGMNPALNLSIGTTKGQGDRMNILNDPEAYIAKRLKSPAITFWLRCILIALACVDLIGAGTSIFMMIFGAHGAAVKPPCFLVV